MEYFSNLELPDKVTLYDYIILSLRKKDIIATFNWDPLLLLAYRRNMIVKPLPEIVFLHGNVYLGICCADKRLGYLDTLCEKCHRPLQPVPLLYPTSKKDYNSNPAIKDQWNKLLEHLRYCYFFTIFGYSAPKTDYEAREMLRAAWAKNKTVEIAQVEIIDIKDREELENNWSEFIDRTHYGILDDFRHSWLWRYPRQTCEALFDASMLNSPRIPTCFPETESLDHLHEFISSLKIEELHF